MGKNKLSIYATDEFINDFKKLLSLSQNHLKLFKSTFKEDNESFNFDDSNLIEKYLSSAKIDIGTLTSISAVVKYIYKNILENSLSSKDVTSELKLLSEKSKTKLSDNKLNILVDLFFVSQNVIDKYNDSPYLRSVVPNLISTTALFDLRTVYNESDEIKCLKPISVIRLETEDDKENKSQFRFQTDLQKLDKLIEFFKEYRDKLSKLEELSKQIKL